MTRLCLLCGIVLHLCVELSLAKPLKGSKKMLNTKALRIAAGTKLSQPNRPPEEIGVEGAFESDIILNEEQIHALRNHDGHVRRKRKTVSNSQYLWPQSIVLYEFDSDLPYSYRQTIRQAIRHWEDLTCIRFKPYSPSLASQVGHNSRVKFYKDVGCQSYIGRQTIYVPQTTTIGDRCNNMGSVAHEIGHVLGFYHEHSRPDRDQYVQVHLENVNPSFRYNFEKYNYSTIRTDEPYDVGSVMHYGSLYYSVDGKSPTILPKIDDIKGFMGQRSGLSFIDVKTANDVYQCSAYCHSSAHCNHGGFTGPDCQCMCPWGLTGATCDEVIPSQGNCGGVLTERDGSFTTPNFPHYYGDNATCHWLILGPSGSNIKLWFDKFEMEDDQDGPCGYDWVEIRTLGAHLPGPKTCGEGPGSHYEYGGNGLYVRFHSDGSYSDFTGFKASYSIEGGEYYDSSNEWDDYDSYNDDYQWY